MRYEGERIFLTPDEAIALLPDRETVHTFKQASFMLIGADWSRTKIIAELKSAKNIEVTGEQAMAMGHGLCLDGKLFIEASDFSKVSKEVV